MQGPGADFQLISILRSSHNGGIYCVHDASGQVVAVKRAQVRGNPQRLAELENEYEMARRCDSPLLRQCFQLIQEKHLLRLESASLVMEYVDGHTLEQSHPENPLHLCRLFTQVAAGLAALHERNILHCDLRPANIMVSGAGAVKLIGLSQACPLGSVKTSVHGASPFIAPEQLRGERLGPTADIYSLGVTLFYLITGRLPHSAVTVSPEALRNGKDKHGPAHQDPHRPLPAALVNFIAGCIKHNPGDRIKSMAAIGDLLRLEEKQLAAELAGRAKAAPNLTRELGDPWADAEATDAHSGGAAGHTHTPLGAIAVLIVDAMEADVALMQAAFAQQSAYAFEVTVAASAARALELLAKQRFAVAVVELNLPDLSGMALIKQLQQQHRGLALVVASDQSDHEQRLSGQLLLAGVHDYLEKEYLDSGALPRVLVRAVQRHQGRMAAMARLAKKQLLLAEKLELVVQQAEQRLRATCDDNPDAIVVVADGVILLANPAAHHLWGVEPPGLTGRPLALDLPHGDAPAQLHDQQGNTVPVLVSTGPTQWEGQPAQVLTIRKLASVAVA